MYHSPEANRGSLHRHIIRSKVLKQERIVDVYLPFGYNYWEKFPVIYMHDGNNLFDPAISFGGVTWDVAKTIESLTFYKIIKPVIVVGIHNTPARNNEYTWTPMEFNGKFQGGRGKYYAKFITSELKPFIDYHYNTSVRREDTAVLGSSLGGLISFYLGLYYPDFFSKIGAMSPSFWWGNGIVYNDARFIRNDLQIWMDMGTEERSEEHVSQTREMFRILSECGFLHGENFLYFEDEGADHNENAWANRLHLPLQFFFNENR